MDQSLDFLLKNYHDIIVNENSSKKGKNKQNNELNKLKSIVKDIQSFKQAVNLQ